MLTFRHGDRWESRRALSQGLSIMVQIAARLERIPR
jgi:hypothetical protein